MQRILNLPATESHVLQQTRVMALNLPVLVSTVRLPDLGGILNWMEARQIRNEYETMVFKCDENGKVTDWLDLSCSRYYSEQEALEGHAETVLQWLGKWVPTEHELPSGALPQLTSGEPT